MGETTIVLDDHDRALIGALADGLPFAPRPYLVLGERCGLAEDEVIARIGRMVEAGAISRFGVVVRHHELGYRANAMVVWDVPDDEVAALGRCFAKYYFVTLCYRRPRRPPEWPYNLFCMIHGRERAAVIAQVERLVAECGLGEVPREVLFSTRRFKQRGARYGRNGAGVAAEVRA